MLIVDDDHKEGRMMDVGLTGFQLTDIFPLDQWITNAVTTFSTSTELTLTLHKPIQQEDTDVEMPSPPANHCIIEK